MNTIEGDDHQHGDDDDVLKVNFDEIVKYITANILNMWFVIHSGWKSNGSKRENSRLAFSSTRTY